LLSQRRQDGCSFRSGSTQLLDWLLGVFFGLVRQSRRVGFSSLGIFGPSFERFGQFWSCFGSLGRFGLIHRFSRTGTSELMGSISGVLVFTVPVLPSQWGGICSLLDRCVNCHGPISADLSVCCTGPSKLWRWVVSAVCTCTSKL